MKKLPKSGVEEVFALGQRQPFRWLKKAESLALTAEAIEGSVRQFWEKPHHGPNTHAAYFMVLGYAVEAFLKGLVVQKTQQPPATIHNLTSLAKTAGVKLDSDEYLLLQRLRESVEWIGRYPLANTVEYQLAYRALGGGGPAKRVALSETDIDPAKKFLDRLRALAAT